MHYCNKMTVWYIIVLAVASAGTSMVVAQEKTCSSFCSSLGMLQSSPGSSCNEIYQINKVSRGVSGLYWINTNSTPYQVYCNMELQCGGHKGGWTRIAQFDTSQGDMYLPIWMDPTPGANSKRVCQSGNDNAGYYSTTFINYNISFYKICGQAKGYQKGSPDSFHDKVVSINDPYVDGLSITLGKPRKHV